jgi:HJR/Mrr/RecB family endonuclease
MQSISSPLYIDDISKITRINGHISCVKFDTETIIIKFYDRQEYVIVIPREPDEMIKIDISVVNETQSILYLSVKGSEIITGFTTSKNSAEKIKIYYYNYNMLIIEQKELLNNIKSNLQLDTKCFSQANKCLGENLRTKDNSIKLFMGSGYDFENYVSSLFKHMGYNTNVTSKSNDQGIDIIAFDDLVKIGIQTKFYNNPVGNKAIQEVCAGKAYYNCDRVCVVTNSSFTKSAIKLAEANHVLLIDGTKLQILLSKYEINKL